MRSFILILLLALVPNTAGLGVATHQHQHQHQYRQTTSHRCSPLVKKQVSSRRFEPLRMVASGIPSIVASTATATATAVSLAIRGGSGLTIAGITVNAMTTIASNLSSGPYGILSLWAIASSVLVPLTMYRQSYSFSVGYGFSVMTMGIALLLAFPAASTIQSWPATVVAATATAPSLLAAATVLYGFRLGSFILLRNFTVKTIGEKMKAMDKTPRLKRIPLAVSVGLFYAFMVSPAMYALRASGKIAAGSIASKISFGGACIALLGASVEAIADGHKFMVKRISSTNSDGEATSDSEKPSFNGPTGGVYQLCRHPNYLGELMFWFGVSIGGAPAFGKSIIAWTASALGLFGITQIMTGATKRLEEKQADQYKGQDKYETYRKEVPATLVPFVSDRT